MILVDINNWTENKKHGHYTVHTTVNDLSTLISTITIDLALGVTYTVYHKKGSPTFLAITLVCIFGF